MGVIARLVIFVLALAAASAAAAVLVVSASFALYALLRGYIGPPGAAACTTLAAAILIGLLALFLFRKAKPAKAKSSKDPASPIDRAVALLRERPAVAASAAAAAGLLAWRNPTLVSTLLRVLEPRSDKGRR